MSRSAILNIEMHPILFKIGNLEIPSFGVMIAIGFLITMYLGIKRAPKYNIESEKLWDLGFWCMINGVLGARLAHILIYYREYVQHPERLFTLRFEGLVSYGAFVAGFLTIIIWSRKHRIPIKDMLDLASVPILTMSAIGRIGCFLNGCCYGAETCSVPWGVHFHHSLAAYHPTQLYDSILSFIIIGIILILEKRRLAPGQSICLMAIGYSFVRFLTEFGRMGPQGTSTFGLGLPISDAQIISVIGMLIGIYFYFKFNKKLLLND